MQKLLTTLAVLTALATPAFAQSFDPDAGTGNVLSFSDRPIVSQNEKITVRQDGIRARSAHDTRHKEGAALSRNWGFDRGICAIPEVNDPVGVWLPPQCER